VLEVRREVYALIGGPCEQGLVAAMDARIAALACALDQRARAPLACRFRESR